MYDSDRALVDALEEATESLLYTSESDYPFEVFLWPIDGPLTVEKIRTERGYSEEVPVEVLDFDDFIEPLSSAQDWHGPDEKRISEGYADLKVLLQENLTELLVFRFGEMEVDIYIVGTTTSGHFICLATRSVET